MDHIAHLTRPSREPREVHHAHDSVAVLRTASAITAIALALPALGMVVGGFTNGSLPIGLFGIAMTGGLGLGYYLLLRMIFKSSTE